MDQIELILLFFTVAAVYASAGFGGWSSYLAAMALFSINMTTMKSTAPNSNYSLILRG